MNDTVPTERRTGALWVAGTGAFLLLAAAAVFVAVRWSSIPDGGKLAIVGGLTGAFLACGRAMRRTLPATGDVLFHLGSFLLPVDLAAVNLRLGAGWRALLLSEGVLATAGLGGLGLATGSVVLAWAGTAGGIVLAAGVAATSPVPGALVLALMAAVAAADRRTERPALVWAGVAGLAPVLSAVATSVTRGGGVLAELGFAGEQRFAAVASGLVAAWVLGAAAARRRDLALVVAAAAAAAVGLCDGWFATSPSEGANVVALAAAFVLAELVATSLRDDPFWSRPAAWIAHVGEIGIGFSTIYVVGLLAFAPLFDVTFFGTEPALEPVGWAAAALALAAAGCAVAALRRPPSSALTGTFAIDGVLFALGAVAIGTASPLATGAALAVGVAVLVAAAEVLHPRPLVLTGAVLVGLWAPVAAWGHPLATPLVGGLAAAVLVVAAARHDSRLLSLAATTAVVTGFGLASGVPAATWAPAAAVAALWATSAVGGVLGSPRIAAAPRWALGIPLLATLGQPPEHAIVAAALAALAYTVEAVRGDDTGPAHAAAVVVQYLVWSIAGVAGLDGGEPGVMLCVGAVVWSGLAALVDDDRWREPLLVAAGLGAGLGLLGAADDGRSLATATMLCGGLLVTVGLASRLPGVAHLGGATAALGLAGHLAMSGVVASEPYLAPVAAQLVLVGWSARRGPSGADVSSWVAYTPAVALLGGAALAERMGGGAGWHAVVAGAVGTVAVAGGGWRRLAGPLFAGTALVVAVTANESLNVVAGVPTWAWLAAGGSALLATGVAMERHDTSPVEAGRRVVDLIAERFD